MNGIKSEPSDLLKKQSLPPLVLGVIAGLHNIYQKL